MTTILGVPMRSLIVIGGDRQGTVPYDYRHGDVTYHNAQKVQTQKLFVTGDGNFLFGMSGVADNDYWDLAAAIIDGSIPLEDRLQAKDFPELRDLHLKRISGGTPDPANVSQLMIASRYDGDLGLYVAQPFGSVEKQDRYEAIGSGANHAKQWIRSNVNELSIRLADDSLAIGWVWNAVHHAGSRDMHTMGYDLAVLTAEGFVNVGTPISDSVYRATQDTLSALMSSFSREKTAQLELDL